MKLSIIGAGKMARAIVSALLQNKSNPSSPISIDSIIGTGRSESTKQSFLNLAPSSSSHLLQWESSLEAAVKEASVVLLSVKPFQIAEVAPQLATAPSSALFVSVAAGISLSSLEKSLGSERKIVRTMPNTPLMIGEGVTAFSANAYTTNKDLEVVDHLFQSSGKVYSLEEKHLDAITALSGSGPAFFYYLINCFHQAALKEGLPESISLEVAAQTALGAAGMLIQEKKSPDQLINQVKSKGGTTEAGLNILEQSSIQQIITDTIQAAAQRSRELNSD